MTLASSLAQVLAAHTQHCFGVMGEGNAAFLHHYERAGGTPVPVRHEAAAVSAADAYYRASGRLAVATTTYGAGFSNAITTLIEAHKARIPLVFVSGCHGSKAKPWDINEAAVLESLDIAVMVAGQDVAAMAKQAVAIALETSQPVVILIEDGTADSEAVEPTAADCEAPVVSSPTAVDIEPIVEALQSAQRPLILAGRGMWAAGATELFGQLATVMDAQIATTAAARNAFPGAPICGGFASTETAAAIAQADVVLSVGASLTPFTMRFGEAFNDDAILIQTSIEKTFHPRANITCTIDAAELGESLLQRLSPQDSSWDAPLPTGVDTPPEADADGRWHPAEIAELLNKALPQQRTVVSDGGHFIGWPATYWDVPDPAAFIQIGTAFKAIGMGTGAATGAAWARSDRATVLVTGDGGLAMALADLPTFAEAPGQRIVVIFNDAVYGAEQHQFAHRGYSMRMASVRAVDYRHIAAAARASFIDVQSTSDLDSITQWCADTEAGMLILNCDISASVLAPFFAEIVDRNPAKNIDEEKPA